MDTTTATTPIKSVSYNRKDGDWAYLLNGEIIGYAPTRLQAEAALNELVYQMLERDNVDAADLTPEEAEAVLEAQQLVAAEEAAAPVVEITHDATLRAYEVFVNGRSVGFGTTKVLAELAAEAALRQIIAQERASAYAEGRAAAQAELEAQERDAGVEESYPGLIHHSISYAEFDLEADGSLEMGCPPRTRDGVTLPGSLIKLAAEDVLALMMFFQMPGVRGLVERADARRQQRSYQDALVQRAEDARWVAERTALKAA